MEENVRLAYWQVSSQGCALTETGEREILGVRKRKWVVVGFVYCFGVSSRVQERMHLPVPG